MAVKFGIDIPECSSENIVGGWDISGQCFYAGKHQGPSVYADTEKEVKELCLRKIEALKKDCLAGYPDPLWEIRIYT